jgi:acyl CoA:acetate/3-ketoacid CoA transferase alpha subunit
MKKNKIATADEAISVIKDGDVIVAAGLVGNETPEELHETYCQDVTGYTTSEEMRSKLGNELVKRGLTPSLYETEKEAETRILI